MLHSFGWIFFLLVGLTVVGLALYVEIGRRRRAAEERRAAWKAHQHWLNSSLPASPQVHDAKLNEDAKGVGPG